MHLKCETICWNIFRHTHELEHASQGLVSVTAKVVLLDHQDPTHIKAIEIGLKLPVVATTRDIVVFQPWLDGEIHGPSLSSRGDRVHVLRDDPIDWIADKIDQRRIGNNNVHSVGHAGIKRTDSIPRRCFTMNGGICAKPKTSVM